MTTITIGQLTTILTPLNEHAVRRLLTFAAVEIDEHATDPSETITRDQVVELWTWTHKREAAKLTTWLDQTRPNK